MGQMDPAATMAVLVRSLPDTVSQAVVADWGPMTYPAEGGYKKQFLGWKLDGPMPPKSDLSQARLCLTTSLSPMGDDECVDLLANLKLVSRPQQLSADEHGMQIRIYSREMRQHPADAVRHELIEWGRNNDFFPTLRELLLAIDRSCGRRRSLLHKIDELLAAEPAN